MTCNMMVIRFDVFAACRSVTKPFDGTHDIAASGGSGGSGRNRVGRPLYTSV